MVSFDFQKHEQRAMAFLKEVAHELETDDLAHTGRVMVAVMHGLRDRITAQESLNLISQLPLYIKAAYIEGWKIPGKTKRLKTQEEFLSDIVQHVPVGPALRDFGDPETTRKKVAGVLHVLNKNVSEGEMQDVKAQLPKPIAELLEA